jgi:hypothetical protein
MDNIRVDLQDIVHTIRIFKGKLEAMCKVVYKIHISTSQVGEEEGMST